jgi:FixJ family two-component response regulator
VTKSRPIIHVVDDDPSFRASIGELLAAFDYRVALYESAAKLLEKPPADELGCILLDLQMRDIDGLQLQDELHARQITLPIVFVTGYGDIPASVRAIKAGAEDFLTKPVPREELFAAIDRALCRHRETREQDDRNAVLRALVSQLTPREHEIFLMLIQSKLNKQIAHELGTTERTIKFHRQHIMQKCNASSLAQLVLMAERLRLL